MGTSLDGTVATKPEPGERDHCVYHVFGCLENVPDCADVDVATGDRDRTCVQDDIDVQASAKIARLRTPAESLVDQMARR